MPPSHKGSPISGKPTVVDAIPPPAPEPFASDLPAVAAATEARALANMTPSSEGGSISLPRIVLLQSLSKEVNRDEDPLPKGQLFNRLTKQLLGTGFDFLALGNYMQRIYLKLGEGLVCRSLTLSGPAQMYGGQTLDGSATNNCQMCVLKDWPRERLARGEKLDAEVAKRGPQCAVVKNFPALMVNGPKPEDYELVLLSFSKTSIAAANDLDGLQRMSRKPWHYFKYHLSVEKATGPQGVVFYKQVVSRVPGRATDEEIAQAVDTIKFLGAKRYDVDDTLTSDLEADEASSSPAGEPVGSRSDF